MNRQSLSTLFILVSLMVVDFGYRILPQIKVKINNTQSTLQEDSVEKINNLKASFVLPNQVFLNTQKAVRSVEFRENVKDLLVQRSGNKEKAKLLFLESSQCRDP